MKRSQFLILTILYVVFVGCAPEPTPSSTTIDSGEVENIPAVYKSSACNNLPTIEEKRACGDEALLTEIDELILDLDIPASDLKSPKLVIEFTISESGKTEGVRLISGVNSEIDRKVLQYVSKTKWTSSIHNGQKMKVKRRLPIYIE